MDHHLDFRSLKNKTEQNLLSQDVQFPSAPNLDMETQKKQGWETLSFKWTSVLLCSFQEWNNMGLEEGTGSVNQIVGKAS